MEITPRDIAAFKAGSWASLPIDYLIEKYGVPYVKKKLGPKAFYTYIEKMPYQPRRLTRTVTPKRLFTSKHKSPSSLQVINRPTKMLVGIVDKKVATSQLNATSLSAHNTQDSLLYNLNQGVEMGQRVGRTVSASHVQVNGYARNLNNTNTLYLRMVCLIDKKPQIGATNTHLFKAKSDDNQPIDFGIGTSMDTVRNPINTDRYTVVSDRRFKLSPNLANNMGNNGRVIKYTMKFNRVINYLTETTGTAVDKVSPNIWFKYWIEKDDGTAGTSQADVALDFYQYFSG